MLYIETFIRMLIRIHNGKKKTAEPNKFAPGIHFGFREKKFWT